MLVLLRCVAESFAEHGLRGLTEMVPGGAFACAVAAGAWEKYSRRCKDDEVRDEVRRLAGATFEAARAAAAEAVRAAVPDAAAADRLALELYLAQVPAAVRVTLKRPDDPTGLTVPATFTLTSGADVLRLLPARPPRFRPDDPVPGLAGWALVEPLGAGGFGEVWLARHRSMLSLRGAVKFCHGRQARDLLHESRVIDRVMAAGRHPNVVPLTNVHLEGESPWLMYEYVSGGDLADLIRQWQRLPADDRVARAADSLRELAAAVGHFHTLTPPVVHRDLKPSNVLVDGATGTLRITDLGIGAVTAKAGLAEDASGKATAAGRLASYLRGSHTPLYASPQQRDGADPDPRDDVHALGVLGYQMLTGRLDQGVGTDFAEDLRDVGVPEELIILLGRCVAAKVDRRPATAAALAAAPGLRQSCRAPAAPARPGDRASPPAAGLGRGVEEPVPAEVGKAGRPAGEGETSGANGCIFAGVAAIATLPGMVVLGGMREPGGGVSCVGWLVAFVAWYVSASILLGVLGRLFPDTMSRV